jgi:hypothetical protein
VSEEYHILAGCVTVQRHPGEIAAAGEADQLRFASGSSTAAMLASSYLAKVLATGTGQKHTPTQLLKKLKSAFKERIIAEGDLESRFAAPLR